jgi:SAM-dependent methyltransferase
MDQTATTIASYEACAPEYAGKFHDFPLYEGPRREFASLLTDGARVLDLGCGPGTMSAYLRKLDRGFRFEGCDLSPRMIEMARRDVPEGVFHIHDLRNPLPFHGTYNAIIASFCIVHLDSHQTQALLDRLPSLCERKAILLLSWIDGHGDGFEVTSFGGDGQFWYCRHDGQKLNAHLKRSGWNILRDFRVDYPNPDGTFDREGFIFAQWL